MSPSPQHRSTGRPPTGIPSGVSRPTHSVYRVVSGEYDDTPCWCAATHNHLVSETIREHESEGQES